MKKIDTLVPISMGLFVFDFLYKQGWILKSASKEAICVALILGIAVPLLLFFFEGGKWFGLTTIVGVPSVLWALLRLPKVPVTKYEPIVWIFGLVLGIIWICCQPSKNN